MRIHLKTTANTQPVPFNYQKNKISKTKNRIKDKKYDQGI